MTTATSTVMIPRRSKFFSGFLASDLVSFAFDTAVLIRTTPKFLFLCLTAGTRGLRILPEYPRRRRQNDNPFLCFDFYRDCHAGRLMSRAIADQWTVCSEQGDTAPGG